MSGVGNVLRSAKNFVFGDPSQGAAQYSGPTNWYTPFSSNVNGRISIDPGIRSMQDQFLAQMTGTGNTYNNTINDIRSRYLGNEGALYNAAVDPIKAAGNQNLGIAANNMGLRGLSGSSFYNDTLSGIRNDNARAVADAGANAISSNLGVEAGLAQDQATMGQTVAGANNQVAMERLQQELASLGLSQQQIGQLIGSFNADQQRYNQFQANRTNVLGMLGGGANNVAQQGGFAKFGATLFGG